MERIIVGLGNPADRHAGTRHNAGFLVLDQLVSGLACSFKPGPGPWLETCVDMEWGRLVLLKPLTFMNLSGRAVTGWLAANRADWPPDGISGMAAMATDMLVVCDDLNLPLGSLRLRGRGSSGGQNGLQDILEALGCEDIARLRLGIAPFVAPVPPEEWADFVLQPFADDEIPAVEEMVVMAERACLAWAAGGVEYAASRFNRRGTPRTD